MGVVQEMVATAKELLLVLVTFTLNTPLSVFS